MLKDIKDILSSLKGEIESFRYSRVNQKVTWTLSRVALNPYREDVKIIHARRGEDIIFTHPTIGLCKLERKVSYIALGEEEV